MVQKWKKRCKISHSLIKLFRVYWVSERYRKFSQLFVNATPYRPYTIVPAYNKNKILSLSLLKPLSFRLYTGEWVSLISLMILMVVVVIVGGVGESKRASFHIPVLPFSFWITADDIVYCMKCIFHSIWVWEMLVVYQWWEWKETVCGCNTNKWWMPEIIFWNWIFFY